MIAGNGRFPLLALETARKLGDEVIVIGIREEAPPEIERLATRCYWISLGELSRLIEILKEEGITEVMLAGQVKHVSIFSTIRPDWRLFKVLASLKQKNTDALIGGVAKVLADEGIMLENSTRLLEPLLAKKGALSRRPPNEKERKNIECGRRVALGLAEYDIGQTVVIAEAACVAVEAMEGTDATIERAGQLMRSLEGDASTLDRALTVVKIAKPGQDMRFDVPVIGIKTIETMARAGASCLAVDAGRCLLLEGDSIIRAADEAGIAVCAE